MNLVVHKPSMAALVVILATLALVVASLLALGAVAHVDLWHLLGSSTFAFKYPG